jgi:hypothetical protein
MEKCNWVVEATQDYFFNFYNKKINYSLSGEEVRKSPIDRPRRRWWIIELSILFKGLVNKLMKIRFP